MKPRTTLLATAAMLVGIAALALLGRSHAQDSRLSPGPRQAAESYARALTAGSGPETQACTTPALWARLAPTFASGPAPGSLGTYSFLDGTLVGPSAGYAVGYLLHRHPDGVEDVVLLTIKDAGAEWRVAGGPAAMTAASPLR